MRQAHTRFQAVLDERNRLAREMHDTLIQGCAGVSALLEAHSSLGESEPHAAEELLTYARTQLRTTIDEAREAVWDLRHTHGSTASIGPSVRHMAEQVSNEFDVPVEYQASGDAFDLDQSAAHELLMVVREALHNAIRHGQPSRVKVHIASGENEIRVEVRDDGRGFDPAQVLAAPNGHYGLIGMRERVARVGGTLDLSSQPGKGAVLTIQIPRNTPLAHDERAELRA
jgi:signal transduction histidine kinase